MRVWLIGLLSVLLVVSAAAGHHDLIIVNGLVIDGSGAPGARADVAVDDGRITAVGGLGAETTADTVIDARGQVVCPGFIDVHTHADESLLENRLAENFTRDGVTSLVTGNCGGNFWPVGAFLASCEEGGVALNVATLVGHNTVRRRVVGSGDVRATPEQLRQMEILVAQAMFEGAVGLSTGLIYTPGTYTDTEEIIALARVAARHGGLYATHMRSEREEIFSAIQEALRVGREAGLPVQISHFKVPSPVQFEPSAYPLVNEILGTTYAPGDSVVAASRATLAVVMRARAAGQDVTLDQYPYTASSTGLATMIPDWVRAEGDRHARELLRDPATRARVRDEVTARYRRRGMEDLDWAVIASHRADRSLNGLSLHEVSIRRGKANPTLEDDVDTAIDLFLAGGAGMVFHTMAEDDVIRIMKNPFVMVCSDSGVRTLGEGVPHPRGYGSNSRVLGRYSRDLHVVPLEEAIRKMTSLPASRFWMNDRGLLRTGYRADIVVFDPARVNDRATFDNPHQYPVGIDWVIVNGTPVVATGETTGALPGMALRGRGYWKP
jgi:N-acyl-D-amino-acid deacylase